VDNFRRFRHLRLERLGRVNLIVGKNNVGKTSEFPALRFYASGGKELGFSSKTKGELAC
jgi:AAA15 family ATPase/GTPase